MDQISLILGKAVDYAAKEGGGAIVNWDEANQLAEGAIAIFDENNALITAATTAAQLTTVQQFKLVTNTGHGLRISPPIDRTARIVNTDVYSAPVAQVTIVGQNAAGTGTISLPVILEEGQIAELTVVDRTPGRYQTGIIHRYYATVSGAVNTEALLIEALVEDVNGHPDSLVVAAVEQNGGNTVGLSLTAKDAGTVFIVGASELISGATIYEDGTNGSTVGVPGVNTLEQILAYEFESNILAGLSNTGGQQQFWWKVPSKVEANADYTSWNMSYYNEAPAGHTIVAKNNIDVMIALPAAAGAVATLTTILGVLMGIPSSEGGAAPDPS